MSSLIPASMATISPHRDIRRCFADARARCNAQDGNLSVMIIAPDGTLIRVPVPVPAEADQSLLRDVRLALSPENEAVTGLTITSINCTTGIQKRARSFHRMLPLIPNLSYLVGAACLGNTVVAFEGHADAFAAGCTDADVLVLDDGMLPFLPPNWAAVALATLRQPRIISFCRDGRLSRLTRLVAVETRITGSIRERAATAPVVKDPALPMRRPGRAGGQ